MIPLGRVVDHLKNIHESRFARLESSGKGNMNWSLYGGWSIGDSQRATSDISWAPLIKQFDGLTFLLNCHQRDFNRSCWVSVLSSNDISKKYEVRISTNKKGNETTFHKNRGPVYSTDIDPEDVLQDQEGVLELSKNQIKKLEEKEEGKYSVYIDYEIIRK